MVVVVEGQKAESLEYAALPFAHRVQHFGHALHVAGAGLESDFDKVSFRESPRQLQQASSNGNQVNVSLGLLAVTEFDYCRSGCELNSRSTMGGVRLGIMCHAGIHYGTG